MCSLKALVILIFLWKSATAQINRKFFRNDYTYLDHTEAFYKIHATKRNSYEAAKICTLEGTKLFYPKDKKEAVIVTGFLRKTQPFDFVFLGASDVIVTGFYETTDGIPIDNLYQNWAQGEPNRAYKENCLVLTRDGTLRDENCHDEHPFICKKTLASLQWNEACHMPDLDYEYVDEFRHCYKFHLNPLNWTDAYAACSAEQSYLTVINSNKEMEYLVRLIDRAPKDSVTANHLRGTIHVGLHNRRNNGWMTVKGVPLAASGYTQWGAGEPNDAGDNAEVCGSVFYGGGYNDIACHVECFFICEHEWE